MALCGDTLVPERPSQKWDGPQPSFFEQIRGDVGEGGASQDLSFGGGSGVGLWRTLSSPAEEGEEPSEPGGC